MNELQLVGDPPTLEERAQALEGLICLMLRGPHVRSLGQRELAKFVYEAGVVLHLLPDVVAGRPLCDEDLAGINKLDPRSGDGWGPWVRAFALEMRVALPARPTVAAP